MSARRDFLKSSALAGTALVIGFRLDGGLLAQETQEKPRVNPFDAWVRVERDGTVRLIVCKSEMGQGIHTALAQILADELDVAWESVRVEQAPTNPALYDHGTGGSTSVRTQWLPLRQAGAAARSMLLEAAAQYWHVNANTCRTENGRVLTGPRGKSRTYAELVEAASKLPVPALDKVPLKNPDQLRLVGRDVARTDLPAKLDGRALFGLDVRVPGMLFAVVARCPTFGGKPKSFDAGPAKAVKGVRQVLEIPAVGEGAHSAGGVAVVADSTWAALKGREALALEWEHGPAVAESTATLRKKARELLALPGKLVREVGQVEQALAGAVKKLEAVYELPFQAHASMEPMNATVHVKADGTAEAWLPSQGPQWGQEIIAAVAGIPKEQAIEKVEVHTTLMGGAFGRRYQADFVVEAAQLSKAVGAPVQVVWTREDDLQHDFYRPFSVHRLEAALDAAGRPTALRHRMASTSIDALWQPPEKGQPERSEVGGAVTLPYALPAFRMEYALLPTRVPVAWWRSVEHSLNGFVNECFVDELAHAAGQDPLAFRLGPLAGPPRLLRWPDGEDETLDTGRFRGVLELVAAKAGWGAKPPAGRARGIAAHFSFYSYVAHVAEVSIEQGSPRVHRVVSAVDCGRVVNPDGARAQIEGGIVYGLTAALKSAITIQNGAVEQSNFHDFELLRGDEMPLVEVHFVPSEARPTGTGEPGLPPIAPAVANALFALTGKRVRRLPITPADLA